MGVEVKGLDGFLKKVDKFAKEAPQIDQNIVRQIGLAAKPIMLAEAARDAGSDLRLSRFARGGKPGPALRVDVRVKQERGRVPVALVMPVPPGPWYLLQKGSAGSYSIVPRGVGRLGKGKGSRTAAAKHAAKQDLYDTLFGAVGVNKGFLGSKATGFAARGAVMHKQVRGKNTWKRGEVKAVAAGEKIFRTVAPKAYMSPLR